MVSEFLYLYVEIGFNTAMLCSLRITHALRGACGVDLCQSFTDSRRTVSAKLIRQSELPADMSIWKLEGYTVTVILDLALGFPSHHCEMNSLRSDSYSVFDIGVDERQSIPAFMLDKIIVRKLNSLRRSTRHTGSFPCHAAVAVRMMLKSRRATRGVKHVDR